MTAASTAYSPKLRTLSVAGMVVARWTGRGLEITKFGWSTPTTRDRVRYLLQLLRIESTPEELASDRTYRVLQVPA